MGYGPTFDDMAREARDDDARYDARLAEADDAVKFLDAEWVYYGTIIHSTDERVALEELCRVGPNHDPQVETEWEGDVHYVPSTAITQVCLHDEADRFALGLED